jgi:hypothetical protein
MMLVDGIASVIGIVVLLIATLLAIDWLTGD